jgi:hypothetical protein
MRLRRSASPANLGSKKVRIDFAKGEVVDAEVTESPQELSLTDSGLPENIELQLIKENA